MPTHIPQSTIRATLSCNACQVNTQSRFQRLRGIDMQAPPAPCMINIPLPPEPNLQPEAAAEQRRVTVETYPLNIASHLTLGQRLKLESVGLTTPVHVHSPLAHVGTITSVPPGQMITALDAIMLLRSIVIAPLDFSTMFSQLSPDMKDGVRKEFFRRTGTTGPRACERVWARFISGDSESDGPLGIDLLLGNREVWGLEACSVDGYSIVHIASVGSV